MIFNLVWLQARQTRSSIKTKVLLRVMLLDTTVHQDVLIKQALNSLSANGRLCAFCTPVVRWLIYWDGTRAKPNREIK